MGIFDFDSAVVFLYIRCYWRTVYALLLTIDSWTGTGVVYVLISCLWFSMFPFIFPVIIPFHSSGSGFLETGV